MNIVEINNIIIQSKDNKSGYFLAFFHTEAQYSSTSIKLGTLALCYIGYLSRPPINATGFRGNGGGVGPFSASDFWLNT